MEDRMLSDEILLGIINSKSGGGGGGGTSNYNDLSNQPQINGNTLIGNKSASDLGLVDSDTVDGILDGTDIDSFGDVETALATKVDKVEGKGLSTNDFTDAYKTAIGDNTTAISGIKDGENINSFGGVESALSDVDDAISAIDSKIDDATTYPYADVITVSDAVPSNLAECNVKIEPVQDLHGYDKPWVGGAGKNKLPYPYASADGIYSTVSITTDWDGTININGTPSGDIYYNLTGNDFVLPQGEYIVSVDNIPNNSRVMLGSTYLDMANKSRTITSDGTTPLNIYLIMNTNTGATNISMKPMIRLATETDNTFAPYTNICPITGHTEASVQRVGRNLLPTMSAQTTVNGITYTPNSDGSVTLNGTATNFSNIDLGRGTLTLPAGQYTSSAKKNGAGNVLFVTYKNASPAQTITSVGSFTLTETTDIFFRIGVESGTTLTNVTVYPQIEAGDTATSYVPHEQTYTIALGDTIYGGTMDFETGVMTVDRAIMYLSTPSYYESSTNVYATSDTISNIKAPASNDNVANCLCENYEVVARNGQADLTLAVNANGRIVIADSRFSSKTDFMKALNGVQLCYELATPITVQLTPKQIQLLQGNNTLYASTGDISVTVNGVSGAIGQVQEQVNELAEQFPDAPTTDGAYVLTVTVADGAATYSWESAE